jgi:hypothetical protein
MSLRLIGNQVRDKEVTLVNLFPGSLIFRVYVVHTSYPILNTYKISLQCLSSEFRIYIFLSFQYTVT